MLVAYLGFVAVFVLDLAGASIDPPEKCPRRWKKAGCFKDRIYPNRPYPLELVNHRDIISKVYDGHILNWKKWPESLHALACRCAELSRKKGHQYFGLQFYGECWSGPSHFYQRDGVASPDRCIGVDFQQCDDNDETECVGKQFTNYIYDLYGGNGTKDDPVHGGWSVWTLWTPCSNTCGGGQSKRKRKCDNPKPANGGRDCRGSKNQTRKCNDGACPKICKRKLEIGVLTDASTSVTLHNYQIVQDFIIKLTREFNVGPNGVHFGMIHYSWDAHLDFTMNDKKYWSPLALQKKINSSEYIYGGTRTDLALYMANEKLFCDGCVRPGVSKVLIVITDGRSSAESDSMTEATLELKETGVTIISMGIGRRTDKDELLEIATDKNHVFLIDNFISLIDKLNVIIKLSCNAAYSTSTLLVS